jgi:hypothetical protein
LAHETKLLWESLRDYRYVGGSQRAAKVVEHAASDTGDVGVLAVPIPFSYRQWIELRINGFD